MAEVAASLPSCPFHITERYSAKRSGTPSWDLCHMQTHDIIIEGRVRRAEDVSALLRWHVQRGRVLPLGETGFSKPG